jgi:hypothetical protein
MSVWVGTLAAPSMAGAAIAQLRFTAKSPVMLPLLAPNE